jgi:hypothetical protein
MGDIARYIPLSLKELLFYSVIMRRIDLQPSAHGGGGFCGFLCCELDGSIFGVTHTPAAPKFELFLRTSSIRSSNFLQTKFEEVRRKSSNILFEELRTFSNRTKKKNVLELI